MGFCDRRDDDPSWFRPHGMAMGNRRHFGTNWGWADGQTPSGQTSWGLISLSTSNLASGV